MDGNRIDSVFSTYKNKSNDILHNLFIDYTEIQQYILDNKSKVFWTIINFWKYGDLFSHVINLKISKYCVLNWTYYDFNKGNL